MLLPHLEFCTFQVPMPKRRMYDTFICYFVILDRVGAEKIESDSRINLHIPIFRLAIFSEFEITHSQNRLGYSPKICP